jgi:hypothetical protein
LKISTSPAFNTIIAELNAAGTDRGVAVLGGSFIEAMTTELLQRALVPGATTDEYLKTAIISSKTNLAHMVGLIPKSLFDDLQKIATIRNKFAHKVEVENFEWGNLKDLIRDISEGRENFSYIGQNPDGTDTPITEIAHLPLRVQYIFKIACAASALEQIAEHVGPFRESTWIFPK